MENIICFDGKSMIITGGGDNFGGATALAFAEEGAGLSLLDIARADPMVIFRNSRAMAASMACDVSGKTSIKAMVEEMVKRFGAVLLRSSNERDFMTSQLLNVDADLV